MHLSCHQIFISTPRYGQKLLYPFTAEGWGNKRKRIKRFAWSLSESWLWSQDQYSLAPLPTGSHLCWLFSLCYFPISTLWIPFCAFTQPPVSSECRLDWPIERAEGRRESLGYFFHCSLPPQHCGSGNGCIPLQLQPMSRASIHNDRSHGAPIPLGLPTHSLLFRPMQ